MVIGEEGLEEREEAVVPFVATTVNLYVVPCDNPFTVIVVDPDVPVSPPGLEVAVYELASGTDAPRTTLAEVEVGEETLKMTGVARVIPVKTKGVPEPTLVQTVPEPGYVVGSPVRTELATMSFQVPEG